MAAVDPTEQVGFTGRTLPTRPAVRVTDASGRPVAGILVSFDPDPGSGAAGSRVVQTGRDGVAQVTWTLGPAPGAQHMRARSVGVPSVTFRATATVGPTRFDIDIRLDSATGTPLQRQAFQTAKMRWESVLTGELPDIQVARPAGFCGSAVALDEVVDDLLIIAEIVSIDGPGGVLGSAGPCLIRHGSDLPVLGRMKLDAADLARLEATGTLDDVIAHEMGHVLGIGSLWDLFGLVVGDGGSDAIRADPHFVGSMALAAFEQIGGASYAGLKVPLEDTGGAGTRLSHWRETVFADELMTGFIDQGGNPLSLVTVASLEDLGYAVDRGATDVFRLPSPAVGSSASRVPWPGPKIALGDDILPDPIFTIDAEGVVRRWEPR